MVDTTGSISDVEAGAIVGAIGLVIKKYGPTIVRVLSKLLVNSSVVDHVKEQGTETALAKLQTPDDIFCVLENVELDEEGRIVLKNNSRVSNLLNVNRPLTSFEKDEVIKVMRQIFQVKKE